MNCPSKSTIRKYPSRRSTAGHSPFAKGARTARADAAEQLRVGDFHIMQHIYIHRYGVHRLQTNAHFCRMRARALQAPWQISVFFLYRERCELVRQVVGN